MTAGRADAYSGGHGSTTFHVEHYDLDLRYRVAPNRLGATAALRVRALADLDELVLDLVGLSVEEVTVAGAQLRRYRHRSGHLTLSFGKRVPSGTVLEVTVRYGGNPTPTRSPWGEVGWEELTDGVIVASQPTGAPSWFPCNDRPADKATYRTSLTVDSPYRVHAHGRLVAKRTRAASTTWVFEEEHPTATYLATVQIGTYDELELAAGPVPQRVLVPPSHRKAAQRWLAGHARIMDRFTELFGPYPFADYWLVLTADPLEIPLEAQGISIFGVNHLDDPDVDRLVPHELAHQWFGNSVSVASWQHIWLNEGFACYAEWLWSELSGREPAAVHAARWHARLAQESRVRVLADPGWPHIFEDWVYKRGALTVHALRTRLGDDVFFALVRDWTARNRHASVTTDDFRALAAEHAARAGGPELSGSVAELLDVWLDEPALPALPVAA